MLKELMKKLDPAQDAVDLLKQDHRKVEALFDEFKSADDKRTRTRVARQICEELDTHAKIEEKIFYPKAKKDAKDAEDEVNEGIVEHEGIKRLVKMLSEMTASDEYFDSRMKVLEEYVKHHVKEEESSMFPKIEDSDIDLDALGERLQDAKDKLQGGTPAASRRTTSGRAAAARAS